MKLFACFLLLVSPVCFAQTFTFNQGGPTTKNYFEEIPFEDVNGHLFITCEIAGKKHRFLFDTGAPVAISKELANELNAKIIHTTLMTDNYLRSDSTTVVELNGLKLGGITFDHIPAINLFPDFYKCLNIDGVIGSNLLRNSIVNMDSRKHLIIFTDQKNKLQLKAKNSAPMISKQGPQSDPLIQFYIDKKVHTIIAFDTGDSQFIRVNDYLISQLKPYGVVDSLTAGYGSGGISAFGTQKNTYKALFKVAPFTIGDGKFTNLKAISNKDDIPAIGSKLLDYGIVTLDFINGKFYFDAYKTDVDLDQKIWTARYGFVDGKLIVAEVWQKGLGTIDQGDQVLAIDGVDYSHITLCEYINSKYVLDGKETAVLTVKNGNGDIKNITINKE